MFKVVDGERVNLTPDEIEEFQNPTLRQPSIDDVKGECRRRILAIMTEDQQRNTLAAGQAAIMEYGANPSSWPVELQERHAYALSAWAEIERLRSRSNTIEGMSPIPADISNDEHWDQN